MTVWQWLLDVAVVFLLLPVLYGIALIVRRRVLSRGGGTFEMSYRARTGKPGRGWLLGLGRYRGETLEWFRIFSLAPRPKVVLTRDRLTYTGRREILGSESLSLYDDHVVVTCRSPEEEHEVAMSEASLMGFQSWLESGPPGADWNKGRLRP
jgi:hypothetical protein